MDEFYQVEILVGLQSQVEHCGIAIMRVMLDSSDLLHRQGGRAEQQASLSLVLDSIATQAHRNNCTHKSSLCLDKSYSVFISEDGVDRVHVIFDGSGLCLDQSIKC